jgi:hypothetical protein
MKVELRVNSSMSAAASTPVYFLTTGALAVSITSSSQPFTPAQTFPPYFTKSGMGSTLESAPRELSTMSAMYAWWSSMSSRVPSLPRCPLM